MTKNQIAYAQHMEQSRHNLAGELETNRSNLARETETHRSNKANEKETKRSNKAREKETHRSNLANEALGNRNASENERANRARENETNRSNLANEALTGASIAAGIHNAQTSAAAQRYAADSSAAASRYASDTNAANVEKQIYSNEQQTKWKNQVSLIINDNNASNEAKANSIKQEANEIQSAYNQGKLTLEAFKQVSDLINRTWNNLGKVGMLLGK